MARSLHFHRGEITGMRVAVSAWNGRISPVFDVARTLMVLDIGGGRILERREIALGAGQVGRIEGLADAGVEVLLCGAISQPFSGLLDARGVKVVPFISGEVEEVVRAYLTGALDCPRFMMPGCRKRTSLGGVNGCGGKGGRRGRMGRPV